MTARSSKLRLSAAVAGLIASLIPGIASAWKPTSHVYFAEIAARDALDDGFVEIPILGTGDVRRYRVDAQTLEALRVGRAQYRAGVLGPDAYPDILTGQQVIHPNGDETGVSGGSDAWLEHVWSSFDETPKQRAFRLGFLTHAAGDTYGHTFINHFSGAPFTLTPPDNAIRHIVLEGYIDKRLPADALTGDFFTASIDGLELRIYTTMVDARPGTRLDALLPRANSSSDMSVPRIFSTLRAELDQDIREYYEHKAELQRRADACGAFDWSCSRIALNAELAGYMIANAGPITYKEYWRDDIDEGLKLWPSVSHQVAVALFFNADRTANTDKADEILTDYATRHILSMAGVPDVVGGGIALAGDIVEAVTPDFLLKPIREMKAALLDTLLKGATGMTKAELKAYLTTPDRYFDQVMTTGNGEHVKLADFNRRYLQISDPGYSNPAEAFDYKTLPATYNTVIASKLVLLPQSEVNRLIRDLGGSRTLERPNVMLGFANTLDGSLQWRSGMVLAADPAVYNKVFKPVPGE